MAADASVFNALIQPVRSVQDYADQYAAADARKQQNALLGLQVQEQNALMQDKTRARQEQEGIRSALSGLGASATDEQRVGALRGLGTQSAWGQADSLEKALGERKKTDAAAAKDAADAAQKQLAVQYMMRDRHLQSLSSVNDPQAAQAWIAQGVQLGEFNSEDAQRIVQGISSGQIPLDQWKQRAQQGGMTLQQQAQQKMQELEYKLKANNELVNPDGTPNQEAINAKSRVASAGKTNISINTEKSYAGQVAEGLAKNDVSLLDAARTAPDRINTARSIKQILDGNKAITGTGAEARLGITKALSTAGLIDPTSTTATEDLVSMLNSQTLEAVKSSGLGSGQGFTDKDRQFLQDAKSGRIEINASTLRRMADLNEKAGLATIAAGNKIAARLKDNPTMGTVGQDLEVQAPAGDALQAAIQAEAARRASLRGGR